jgi:hypothetical protein
MAQVVASGFTIRWHVPKIPYTSNGRIAAYQPTTGSKPISSAYAMAAGNTTAATDMPAADDGGIELPLNEARSPPV